MVAPTVDQILSWSKLDFDGLDEPFDSDDLVVVLDRSIAYILVVTGQTLAAMPAQLEPIASEAIQMRVEQTALQAGSDYTSEASDDLISNFSAGNYSQTRRDLGQTSPSKGIPLINSNPALNMRLWLLCTDDMREYWWSLMNGLSIPATETTEIDWGNYDGLYPYSTSDIPSAYDSPFIWGA